MTPCSGIGVNQCGIRAVFADDPVIIATSLEKCVACVKAWNEGMESKALCTNMTKMKIIWHLV